MAIIRPVKRVPGPGTSTLALQEFEAADQIDAATISGEVPAGVTVPWVRLTGVPATFPPDAHVHSGADVTSGTLPDGRFPATLPAASGVNLTALNASNLASGNIPYSRMPTGAGTWDVGAANLLAISGSISVASGESAFFDGGGDTYIHEPSANVLAIVAGGSAILQCSPGEGLDSLGLTILRENAIMFPTKKLYLDGGGDTYVVEAAANVLDLVVGGVTGVRIEGGAVLVGTTVVAGAAAGSLVLPNGIWLRGVRADGTTTDPIIARTSTNKIVLGNTRAAPAVPANFVANFMLEFMDAAGNAIFIPAMNAGW